MNGQLHALALYRRRKRTRYPLNRRAVEHEMPSGRYGKERNYLLFLGCAACSLVGKMTTMSSWGSQYKCTFFAVTHNDGESKCTIGWSEEIHLITELVQYKNLFSNLVVYDRSVVGIFFRFQAGTRDLSFVESVQTGCGAYQNCNSVGNGSDSHGR